VRWAYAAFVVLGLLYLPASEGFHLHPQRCDPALNIPVLFHSLSNYAHIVLFAFFFVVTARQFRSSGWRSVGWSIGLTMAMGAAVEIVEGLSGAHHCKASDLVPDFIGAMLGVMVVVLAGKLATLRLRRRSDDNNPIIGSETVR
jgi:VanZ family protein